MLGFYRDVLFQCACLRTGKTYRTGLCNQQPASTQPDPPRCRLGKRVEKRTDGRVKITVFGAGTLLAGDKCYDGVLRGIADVGLATPGFTRGRFPLTEVLDLPLGYKNATAATRLANVFYNKFKPKEWNESQVMYLTAHGPGVLHSKRAVNSFDDFKGLKIRCTGLSAKIAAAIGAAPVAMTVSETYDALSRGVVDATFNPTDSLRTFRLAEVIKVTTEIPSLAYTSSFVVVMNKKKWAALPQDIQKIIEKINEEWIERHAKAWEADEKSGREFSLKMGNKIVSFPKADDEKVGKAVRPLLDDYVNNTKKNGLPGDEALSFCMEQLKKLQ